MWVVGVVAVVSVSTTGDGAPSSIVWDGQTFSVIRKPQQWIDRNAWWVGSVRAPRGSSAGLLERLVYRVEVRSTAGAVRVIDLCQGDAGWALDEVAVR
ncbi:DUF6504 family protein [Agreia sp. COWG]|uniref:DUF6504 family protein n=1 Tax=Agreia sp. COWG TaxID=2773266 RepID=UPI0019283109|nr:DUF6504 family protein [Agreia sp. COWG]CAD6015798.1 conserved protein of unknown function [Agreia sp. COWG]